MVAGESVLGTNIWSKEFRSRSGGEAAFTLELCNEVGIGSWHRAPSCDPRRIRRPLSEIFNSRLPWGRKITIKLHRGRLIQFETKATTTSDPLFNHTCPTIPLSSLTSSGFCLLSLCAVPQLHHPFAPVFSFE